MLETENIMNQFESALKRGTGEAFIILKENRHIDFSDLIIKGAITNYAYDSQSEGSRADYIYRFVQKAKQKDKIINAILITLQSEKNDYWGLDQMCDLVVKFHKAGNTEAKTALYNRLAKNNLSGYESCGQEQIMVIDGINGVLKVAEMVGKMLIEDPDDYEDSWKIDHFQKRNKSVDVYEELRKASTNNEYIKAYYESILQNKNTLSKRSKVKKFTYEMVKEQIERGSFYFHKKRSLELSNDEVEMLANEFLSEQEGKRKEGYLSFFGTRQFPFDYHPILQLASATNPEHIRITNCALKALRLFSAKEIRELALEKLKTAENPDNYLQLLINNYKKDDHEILIALANHSDDYDYIHSLVFGFVDIYKANATEDCKIPLETIYNKMNCGIHREDIVKILHENNVLADKIFAELEFDSLDTIRKLFRRYSKEKNKSTCNIY